MKRVAAFATLVALVLTGCSMSGGGTRTYKAEFTRAIQVFPAVKVRVLGVDDWAWKKGQIYGTILVEYVNASYA